MKLFVLTCQVTLVFIQQCLHNKHDVQASHVRHAHDIARHSKHYQKSHNKQSHRIPIQRITKYLRNTKSEETLQSVSSENLIVRRSRSKKCSCSCNQCNKPKSCCKSMCQSCSQKTQQSNAQWQYNPQPSSLEDPSNMLVVPFPIPYLVYPYNESGTMQSQKTTREGETKNNPDFTKASTTATQTTSFYDTEIFSRIETPPVTTTSSAAKKPTENTAPSRNETPSENKVPIETDTPTTKTSNKKPTETPTKTEPNTSKDAFKLRKATTRRLNPLVRLVTLKNTKRSYQNVRALEIMNTKPIDAFKVTSSIIPQSRELLRELINKNQEFHDITRDNGKDELSGEVYYEYSEEPNEKQKLNDSACDAFGNCYLRNWANSAYPVKAALRSEVTSNTLKSSLRPPLLRLRPTIANPRNRRLMNNLRNRKLNIDPRTGKLRAISMGSPRRRYPRIRNDKFANRLIKDLNKALQ